MSHRKMGPLKENHPLVAEKEVCPVCEIIFETNDEVTLIATVPASVEDAKKAQAGKAYNSQAAVVHWNCRGQ